MNITQISLRNFRSWEHLDLEITPGCTLLAGQNGAGKSSILEAALFAMYGATSDAGSYIRRGTDEARVSLWVQTERGLVTIGRDVRRSGGKVAVRLYELWLGSENLTAATTTETQAVLDDLLGVSREVLLASAFSTQHGGAAFTEAAPRDRKRIFGEILALGMWDTLADEARAELKAHKDRAQLARALVEQYDGAGDRLFQAKETAFSKSLAADDAAIAERQAEAQAARLAGEAEAAREARRQHAAAVEAAERARADHERATGERRAADEALERAKTAAANAPSVEDARAALESAMYELGEAQERHEWALDALVRWRDAFSAATRARQELLDEAETGNCARCGQPLHADVTERLDAATAAVRDFAGKQPEVLPLEEALAAARTAAHTAQTRLAEAETIQALAGSIDAAQQRADVAKAREDETQRARFAAFQIVESFIAPGFTGDAEAKHTTALTALDAARVTHRDAALDLARAEAAAQQAEHDANSEAEARAKLAAAQADAAIAEILAAGFGPTGVPALVIDNVLGQLADESNRVLAELGTPVRINLVSQRVTQKGELRDALDILVLDGVNEAPYETLSGGERTRVALALRAALTRLLAAKSGARVRILVVDEPQGLDAAGAEAFADVLQAFITAGIFDTAIVVTHDERLADRIDRVIRVEKSAGGESRMADSGLLSATPLPGGSGSSGGAGPDPSRPRIGVENA